MKVKVVRIAIGVPDDMDDQEIESLVANVFATSEEPASFIQTTAIESAIIVTEREWKGK